MKDTQLKKRLILITLFLSLIVLVENTANLYGYISNLLGTEKTIAMYFMGISGEIGIFVCIYCGSSTAGLVFAVISFFVGMTFHNWNHPVFFYSPGNWSDFSFIPTKRFFASLLLQTMNSAIVWYLSELYVKFIEVTNINEQLTNLNDMVTDIEQRRNELSLQFNGLTYQYDEVLTEMNQEKLKINEIKLESERVLNEHKEKEKAIERRIEDLKRQALSLQNSNNKKSSIVKSSILKAK